jgi:hypothetical protein
MDLRLCLKGETPYLQHNERTADPEDEFAMAIHDLTSKRTKTPKDYAEIRRLEWFAGIYAEDGKIVVPTRCLKRMLADAGKLVKLQPKVIMATVFTDMHVELIHDGPRDLVAMQKEPRFTHKCMVGVNGRRVARCRPRFLPWAITANIILIDTVLSRRDFERVVELSAYCGLGDHRGIGGFGRHTPTLENR